MRVGPIYTKSNTLNDIQFECFPAVGYEMVNGRYVKFYNTKMSWQKASDTCQNASTRLIVAHDAKTRSWIKNRYSPMWIGGYRKILVMRILLVHFLRYSETPL